MATLRIKNLGPVVDSGVIDLTPFTVLIGRQSSGKSTFMKVLCYCRWLEKKIMISPESLISTYTHNYKFLRDLKQFHRLNDMFFNEDTLIEYKGDSLNISLKGNHTNPKIDKHKTFNEIRYNSKLCYIPAERNLISAVKNIDRAYKASDRDVLFNFMYEWEEGRGAYSEDNPMELSVTDHFRYIDVDGIDKIVMPNGDYIPQYYASSGLQSVAPIDVLTDYVTNCIGTTKQYSMNDLSLLVMEYISGSQQDGVKDASTLTEEMASQIAKRMKYQSAQVFIEEPEQNLYPDAQRILVHNVLKRLVKAKTKGSMQSMVVLTTHSPYVLSVLNVYFAQAAAVEKLPKNEALQEVVEKEALLSVKDFSAYFIDADGKFQDIRDMDIPMFSGNELDSVSDWVDNKMATFNKLLYGAEK